MTTRRTAQPASREPLVIMVRAKPRSSVSALTLDGTTGTWVARLRSSPVDGAANAELVALVAKHFGCSKTAVSILSGASARLKLVQVAGGPSARADRAA
jgi:uncharacterized protein YggU (UPF0235/DUF167 family)